MMRAMPLRAADTTGARLAALAALLVTAILSLAPLSARAALPIEHWVASSGAQVYFVRAPAIPMLDLRIDFDAGARFEPPGKTGLASLTQALLARGTEALSEAEIAEGFADVAARRGGGVGDDRATVSLRTLTSAAEREAALALLERVLSKPSFPADVLEREKARYAQLLREAATRPQVIVSRNFAESLYGDHPYGRHATPETIAAIERADLERFYREHYGAKRAVVSLVGAIDRAEAEAIADRLTAGLPAGGPRPELEAVPAHGSGKELRIAHPATQSHIRIGDIAISRDSPDYYALFLGNHVLGGGGFTSRLTEEVREKRGLAYSVYSYFSPALQKGTFTIGLQTSKAQTDEALAVVRETVAGFVREGPSAEELRAAKDNLIGGFALRLDSNGEILGHLATIGIHGLGTDYLDRWTERIERLTVDEVRAAFARHVDPARLTTVVVGAGPER